MNMVNRLICRINRDYHLRDILNKMNENQYAEEESRTNPEITLKSFIETNEIVEADNFNFIYGTYYYEYDAPAQIPIITREGARIRDTTIIKSNILNFWINDENKAFFSKSDKDSQKGRAKLSEFLFDNDTIIEPVEFNISQIERSVIQNGEFEGMWTTSFNDRAGAINSGVAYGENIHEDLVFNDIGDTTKNSTGITYNFMNENVKVRINRKGTIQIPGKHIEQDNLQIFDLIREFDNYIQD